MKMRNKSFYDVDKASEPFLPEKKQYWKENFLKKVSLGGTIDSCWWKIPEENIKIFQWSKNRK